MKVRRVALANWALQAAPKFTVEVKYKFHWGFSSEYKFFQSGSLGKNETERDLWLSCVAQVVRARGQKTGDLSFKSQFRHKYFS